jgi:hypothetical protein
LLYYCADVAALWALVSMDDVARRSRHRAYPGGRSLALRAGRSTRLWHGRDCDVAITEIMLRFSPETRRSKSSRDRSAQAAEAVASNRQPREILEERQHGIP